jgi:hypothetical protein
MDGRTSRVAAHDNAGIKKGMGRLGNVQSFYQFCIVPGVGHVTPNGTANLAAHPPDRNDAWSGRDCQYASG